MGLLIDSTVVIRAERAERTPAQLVSELVDAWGDVELAVSVMSAGELFHGCWRADTPVRRARPVMRVFGEIDARLCARGQRLPTSDLLIGCTALTRGDEVVTGNPRHFNRIPGLRVHRLR